MFNSMSLNFHASRQGKVVAEVEEKTIGKEILDFKLRRQLRIGT